jgi:ATP-dependent Clp protease ATP-binding subunit ClpA
MVEPSDNLQAVFEKAIETAKKLHHEYLTIEHLLFAMLMEETFANTVQSFGANSIDLRKNLAEYLQNQCAEITVTDVVIKPKKTQSVERVLNRAFTQVLFNGRQRIEPTDVFLAMMGEKRSWAHFYIAAAEIDKDKFADFLNNNLENDEEESVPQDPRGDKALQQFTTNLNEEVKKNKIDPVIGRIDELENISLALGRRSKNNVILVGDPGVGKTAIA